MKKLILTLSILLIASPVFADNSARIKELQGEFTKCQQRFQQLEAEKVRVQEAAQRIVGAIVELKNQDAAEKKKLEADKKAAEQSVVQEAKKVEEKKEPEKK